ncbi:MAG: glycosyltransferase [Ignavibacteriaceae bacterium]
MHILVITPGFPDKENDTDCIPPMQEYFYKLTELYPSVKITIVSVHYPYKNSVYSWKSVKIYSCGGRSAGQPRRIFYWMRAIHYARKINKENKIDIIHSFWLSEAALIGTFLSLLFNVRHINTMMGQDVKRENKYLKLLPLNYIIKVAVSEFQSKVFYQSTEKNSDYIIPWGLESFNHFYYERNIDLIGVGALIPVKNFKLFIEIIAELKKHFPAVNCLLIGEGIQKHEIEFLREKNNLKNNIFLTGHIPREEVLTYMKRSKILLHTSDFESFCYVIVEALASGCYVVCKNVGCAKESGKITIANNFSEFTTAVLNILNKNSDYNPELLYPLRDTVSSYMNLYEKIIPPHP